MSMKKVISALLVLAMVLGLCACGQSQKPEQPTENKAITLTKENVLQYLNITVADPVPTDSEADDDEIITVKIYPTEAGDFSNVDLILFLDLSDYDLLSSSGGELNGRYSEAGTISFELPADGRYDIDIRIDPTYSWSDKYDAIDEYKILSASGTFTPAN